MDAGVQLVFASYGWDNIRDSQVYEEELKLARLADELGYNVAWAVEHHFFDYSFCPDNTELLAYLAGVTRNIDLGTAAVIMPWNEPLRVAERVSLLDHLAGGRLRFGMGRGLSRREYAAFPHIDMGESRERFDESAAMVVEALETGFVEGDGPFYPQPRIEIRPRPERGFKDRLYAVASSDDSIDSAARLGAAMVMFADRPWENRMPGIDRYRESYREYHHSPAPPPLTADFMFCHPDADYAADAGKRYLATYLASVLEHYEVMGDHFAETKGYDAYASAAKVLQEIGESGMLKGFLSATASGTPDQILEKLSQRWQLMGKFELASSFRFGGIPYDEAEQSMRLFAREVLPVIQSWE